MNEELIRMTALTDAQRTVLNEALAKFQQLELMGVMIVFDRENDNIFAVNLKDMQHAEWACQPCGPVTPDGMTELEFWEAEDIGDLHICHAWGDDHLYVIPNRDNNLFNQ